jgi:flagella basal body P-ring formation protein FlgA
VLEVFEKPTPNTVTDKSMIERAITIRRLLPGSVVRFSDLHVSPHVSKGTTATLYFTMEKLSVRLEVIVMEDGYIGDTVKVRNEESGEEMFATVTDEGKVAIN